MTSTSLTFLSLAWRNSQRAVDQNVNISKETISSRCVFYFRIFHHQNVLKNPTSGTFQHVQSWTTDKTTGWGENRIFLLWQKAQLWGNLIYGDHKGREVRNSMYEKQRKISLISHTDRKATSPDSLDGRDRTGPPQIKKQILKISRHFLEKLSGERVMAR